MEEQNTLKKDLKKAQELLKQEKLEQAGHQLKQISIKAYYASKDSEIPQKWLDLHKTTSLMGHTFLKEDGDAQHYRENHRRQVITMLEDLTSDNNTQLKKDTYVFTGQDHVAALKDRIEFLEEELEKSQEEVLKLRKEYKQN